MPTVLAGIKTLQEKGLVRETGTFASTGGRKAGAISPVHNARYAVGLDITQNHLGLVLTDLSGTALSHLRVRKQFEYTDDYLHAMALMLDEFIAAGRVSLKKVLGVGIAIAGIVNHEEKTIAYSHVLGIAGVPCAEFSRYIRLPCVFVNDANAAAIAELYAGERKNCSIYLSLSNSVGGALIFPGLHTLVDAPPQDPWQVRGLYMGRTFKSGEVGHMTVVPQGEQCYCGQYGCFNVYCSATALSSRAGGELERFFDGLEAGDPALASAWETYLDYLALAINSLRMVMDCDIIVGGYVGNFMGPYLSRLKEKLKARNPFGEDDYVSVCTYRVEASALGAALMVIEAFINAI